MYKVPCNFICNVHLGFMYKFALIVCEYLLNVFTLSQSVRGTQL